MENTMQNSHNALVSVVMATYNGEAFIAAQIDSVLSQSYDAVELIICDDGSSDKTLEIVELYKNEHPCITLYQNSENLGFVKNFEKGICLSKGQYIALCDQDDIWECDKLKIQMDALVKEELASSLIPVMVHSNLCMVDVQNRMQHDSYFKFKKYTLKETKDLGHIVGPSGVMGNTILFNQALKEKILPFPDCLLFHDQWIALVNEVCGKRVTLDQPLVRYRIHSKNTSNTKKSLSFDSLGTFSSFVKSKIRPPYLDSARACMIEHLMQRCTLKSSDKILLDQFLEYLHQKEGSFAVLLTLWNKDLIKRDLWYRVGFSINYLLFKEKEEKIFLFGFSHWKRKFIKPFFISEGEMVFCASLEEAVKKGLNEKSKVYIWGKRSFPNLESYAKKYNLFMSRVEDGFIRSVSLGSDLTKAYSLVKDSRGIYFDPTQESDLEYILNTTDFDEETITRAQNLQKYLKEKRISKYNADQEKVLILSGVLQDQKVILVPGQVEDDASIVYGADGMSNLELLKCTKESASDAYIIFKPHPDVLAGNRKGHVNSDKAVQYADLIIKDTSLDSILDKVDEVHTMTSLVGFEALIRGKKVITYGLPFYAGWGLTQDMESIARRKRILTLDELVAATLICYAQYIDPRNDKPCEIEVLLGQIDKEKSRYNESNLYKLYRDGRNAISRKIQRLIKGVKGE